MSSRSDKRGKGGKYKRNRKIKNISKDEIQFLVERFVTVLL